MQAQRHGTAPKSEQVDAPTRLCVWNESTHCSSPSGHKHDKRWDLSTACEARELRTGGDEIHSLWRNGAWRWVRAAVMPRWIRCSLSAIWEQLSQLLDRVSIQRLLCIYHVASNTTARVVVAVSSTGSRHKKHTPRAHAYACTDTRRAGHKAQNLKANLKAASFCVRHARITAARIETKGWIRCDVLLCAQRIVQGAVHLGNHNVWVGHMLSSQLGPDGCQPLAVSTPLQVSGRVGRSTKTGERERGEGKGEMNAKINTQRHRETSNHVHSQSENVQPPLLHAKHECRTGSISDRGKKLDKCRYWSFHQLSKLILKKQVDQSPTKKKTWKSCGAGCAGRAELWLPPPIAKWQCSSQQ